MGERIKLLLLSFFLLSVYVLLNYYFIFLVADNQINLLSQDLEDLKYVLDNISHKNLVLIVTIISTFTTTLGLLVQYLIGKFLLVIFASNVQSHLFHALIPKVFIMIINLIFMGVLEIHNTWLYLLTALIGSILILFFFQYKKQNWKASLLFSSAFIIDALFSLCKTIFSV
ncbi:hypothetical protein JNUCC74_09225 [Cerasibacillus sp. JNUCC 74]